MRKKLNTLKAALNTNASFRSLEGFRKAVYRELDIAEEMTIQQIFNTAQKMSCSPSGFSRIVYCESCKTWYYTHSRICLKCHKEGNIQILFKGCDVPNCPCYGRADKSSTMHPRNDEGNDDENDEGNDEGNGQRKEKEPQDFCTHQRRSALTKELLVNLTLSFVGDLVGAGWLDEFVDAKRSRILRKAKEISNSGVICPSTSFNSLQNYAKYGRMKLQISCGIIMPMSKLRKNVLLLLLIILIVLPLMEVLNVLLWM